MLERESRALAAGRLLPGWARERLFLPAVGDLMAERHARGEGRRGPIVALRILAVAGECAFRAITERLRAIRGRRSLAAGTGNVGLPRGGGGRGPARDRAGLFDTLAQEGRAAIRGLTRSPAFATGVVAVLALGIGANTVFFALLNSIVLRPLPYPEPDRLVYLTETSLVDGERVDASLTAAGFADWRRQSRALSSISAYFGGSLNVLADDRAERIDGLWVSSDLFETLGVAPIRGRTFRGDPGAWDRREVLISHGFWQRWFGGGENAIGADIRISSARYRVVGVMPRDFAFADLDAEIYLAAERDVPAPPIELDGGYHDDRDLGYLDAVGRIAPGFTLEQAQEDLAAVQAEIAREFPDAQGDRGSRVRSLHEHVVGDVRGLLEALLAAVGAVLLIGAANVAGLMLARASDRRRELSIRAALGASRARLVRQLVIEGTTLGLVGAGVGLTLAALSLDAVTSLLPFGVPRTVEVGLDGSVAGFALALGLVVGLACGLVPGLQARRGDLRERLEGVRGAAEAPGARRARSGLVVAEIAISLVLVVLAGLTAKAFIRLIDVDPGFDPAGVLATRLVLPADRYAEDADVVDFHTRALERLAALPGVDHAGLTLTLPFSGAAARVGVYIDAVPVDERVLQQRAVLQSISPDYFATMGIPLLRGRSFDAGDTTDGESVVIVNEELVRRYVPEGVDALEARVNFGDDQSFRIVGVAATVRHRGYEGEPEPELYAPYPQFVWRFAAYVVRTSGDPEALVESVRTAFAEVDPLQTLVDVQPVRWYMSRSVSDRRLAAAVLGVFAITSLLLSAIGVFAVINYAVGRRIGEIGVRMALGADARAVLAMVVRQGILLVGAGVLAGLAGGWALQRLITIQVDGVELLDPQVIVLGALVLMLAALAATLLPAVRATRVDPANALRAD